MYALDILFHFIIIMYLVLLHFDAQVCLNQIVIIVLQSFGPFKLQPNPRENSGVWNN